MFIMLVFTETTGVTGKPGEDSAAVLSLCTKFTIATSCTCIFDKDISSIIIFIIYNTKR